MRIFSKIPLDTNGRYVSPAHARLANFMNVITSASRVLSPISWIFFASSQGLTLGSQLLSWLWLVFFAAIAFGAAAMMFWLFWFVGPSGATVLIVFTLLLAVVAAGLTLGSRLLPVSCSRLPLEFRLPLKSRLSLESLELSWLGRLLVAAVAFGAAAMILWVLSLVVAVDVGTVITLILLLAVAAAALLVIGGPRRGT